MADARFLRIVTITTFLPAFALCIAHGSLSNSPVPAVGLAPLAVSASTAIFLLSRYSKRSKQKQRATHTHDDDDDDGHDVETQEEEGSSLINQEQQPHVLAHPILVFLVDSILAAALMVVLVFTWIRTQNTRDVELAMLAAYATIPLLINFLIHLYLAVREFIAGLALHGLVQHVAWQTLPPDCPHCGNRLRPDSLPAIPWYESVSAPKVKLPSFKVPSVTRLTMPAAMRSSSWRIKGPEWKTPAWLKGRRAADDANLFVNYEEGDDDARERYTDEPEVAVGSSSAASVGPLIPAIPVPEPVVEEVVVGSRRGRRGEAIFGEDENSWS
ncbi:hypothetical protein B0T17DRAFT_650988 [Bombardia bombarda]|uniref:Uncharacterized protein n=1 Tax=Bombardia bombarda TaxID=252184 RepID=A0AA39XLA2_9PEZI|nr:hypothetical protein B0T17DRAFT_650988 [Bombardia bombarda]